jgi:integrase
MASISGKDGRWTIQFTGDDGRRRSIRLGKMPAARARSIKTHVEELVSAKASGMSVSRETSLWLKESCGDELRRKFGSVGLVAAREQLTVQEWFDRYIEERSDVRASTVTVIRRAQREIVACLGRGRLIASVRRGDASQFAGWMRKGRDPKPLAEQTARRMTGIARQLFREALRRGYIEENPFDGLKVTTSGNPARHEMVSAEAIAAAIRVASSAEWRLLLALARWGGVRVPSEPWALRWSDIDWERHIIRIPEIKTAGSTGRAFRPLPLFHEIRPHLEAVRAEAAEGAEFVFASLRALSAQALRKQFLGILAKARQAPWPRLWQNLRSTRATELANMHPAHVVAAWLGHTVAVATKHYLQITDDHLARALAGVPSSALQNAVQHPSANDGTERNQ